MSRKKKDRNYYGIDQEEAVVSFLNAKNVAEREQIYREYLQEPINTMIESIIRTYKLYRQSYEFNDLQWVPLGEGFPPTIVTEIKYFEKEQALIVSTFGRGLWAIRY